ncbi:MAG: hypothetical protein IPH89_14140 [Bacteroidetes bacterium]|nr:hypothetical protein [Bacteroidota bacterium]
MKIWIKTNRISLLISVFFYIVFQAFYMFAGKEGKIYCWLFLYISLLIFFNTLPKNKFLTPILLIIQIPILLLNLIHPFIQTGLMFMLVFVSSFVLLSLLFNFFPEYPFGLDLNLASKLYLILILGSVILTLWGARLIKYFNSIVNNNRTEEREKAQLEFTLEIVNKDRITFLIYLFYFLYLIPYSVSALSNISLFGNPSIDKSIFNAFISYTAFERVLANTKLIKIDFKKFLSKLFKAWE